MRPPCIYSAPTPSLGIPGCQTRIDSQTFRNAVTELPQSGPGPLLRAPTREGLPASRFISRSRVDPRVSLQVTPTWPPSCFLPRGKLGLRAGSGDRADTAPGAAARAGQHPSLLCIPRTAPGTPGHLCPACSGLSRSPSSSQPLSPPVPHHSPFTGCPLCCHPAPLAWRPALLPPCTLHAPHSAPQLSLPAFPAPHPPHRRVPAAPGRD